ncbi:hypothetical protein JY651_11120 [Pyxidicoccus parkwayensis]|uniref:Uncharacterized protein n=1 Tax=Pyxidicoccus parkwayensis TaxID=2813578 RepID=A0ABX7P4T1_9BACT|nr:DUF6232 family protein [Pyxidicoccus parkwaysis]QSQ25436.1 hypothetical protein JY651_11120 [Pyxidicoccus parkwaysis]
MMKPQAAVLLPNAPVLPQRPVAVALPPVEVPLFQAHGVLVTSECVVARGKTLPLADVQRVESVRRSPSLRPVLATLALSMSVGLPMLSALSVAVSARKGVFEAGLVLLAVVFFGSMARLLLAEDSYQVVLHTREGAWRVLSSSEVRTSTRLVALLEKAVDSARWGN